MAQRRVTLTVSLTSDGEVSATFAPPLPLNLNPDDEVIWEIQGAAVNQIQLILGGNTKGVVKLTVIDAEGKPLNWVGGNAGVNIPPPPPPPGGVRNSIAL